MNRAEMTNTLRKAVGSPPEDQVPDSELWEYLNQGYMDVATRYPQFRDRSNFEFATSQGTDLYGLPDNAGAIVDIKLAVTGKSLDRGSFRDYNRWASHPQGQPRMWARDGGNIRVYPVPDKAYQLVMVHKVLPPPLAHDSDIPNLNEDWHYGIILRARWYYWDTGNNDFPKASAALQSYNVWIADKPSGLEEERAMLDQAVQLPELKNGYGSRFRINGRYDDGSFDYRE